MKLRKSYILATVITALFAILSLSEGFNIYSIITLVVLVLPLPLSDMVAQKLAFVISLTFVVISLLFLLKSWTIFSEAESLSGFEGPIGEGSPIAPIISISMMGLFFIIPWSIASIRCYRNIKTLY